MEVFERTLLPVVHFHVYNGQEIKDLCSSLTRENLQFSSTIGLFTLHSYDRSKNCFMDINKTLNPET